MLNNNIKKFCLSFVRHIELQNFLNALVTVSDKNVANKLLFLSIWGLYEFSRGFTAERRRTGVEPLKLVIVHIMQRHHISQISWDMWPFVIGLYIIIKALNGFLMIGLQGQLTLKVYCVKKLHRPRMSHGLLADSVDTTLIYIVVQQLRYSVNCTIS